MTYALLFALIAAVLGWSAWTAAAWWSVVPLAWAALACAAVALAYGCSAPWVFGKRADGGIPWTRQLPLLPYRALGLAIWWLAARFSGEPPWQRIDGRLVVGRRLRDHEVPPGITTVLDLTCEFPEVPRLRAGVVYRCLPLLDARAGDPRLLAATVRAVADQPGTLFIHCAQGHGRTGLVAALVLAARTPGLGAREALARLRAIRPGIGLSAAQLAALDRVAELLGLPAAVATGPTPPSPAPPDPGAPAGW